jgi:dihydroflavonol-4-reductase
MHLREILEVLARASGLPGPRMRIPHWVAYAFSLSSELKGRLTGKPAQVPLESVRLSRHFMYFDSQKAVRDLGLPQSPVEGAFRRAVLWFRKNGYAPAGD